MDICKNIENNYRLDIFELIMNYLRTSFQVIFKIFR